MKKAKIKLIEEGKAPIKGSEKASCWDLFARDIHHDEDDPYRVIVSLGVAIEPPEGYDVRLYSRSSIGRIENPQWMLTNCVGIGDEDYRGEYMAIFYQVDSNAYPHFPYKVGDRCIQMEFKKKDEVEVEIVEELSDTERGEGGFGSTGR